MGGWVGGCVLGETIVVPELADSPIGSPPKHAVNRHGSVGVERDRSLLSQKCLCARSSLATSVQQYSVCEKLEMRDKYEPIVSHLQ